MQFIRRLFGPSSKVSDPVSVTKVSYLSDSQTNAVVIESNVTSSSLSGTTLTPASVTIEEAVNNESKMLYRIFSVQSGHMTVSVCCVRKKHCRKTVNVRKPEMSNKRINQL